MARSTLSKLRKMASSDHKVVIHYLSRDVKFVSVMQRPANKMGLRFSSALGRPSECIWIIPTMQRE